MRLGGRLHLEIESHRRKEEEAAKEEKRIGEQSTKPLLDAMRREAIKNAFGGGTRGKTLAAINQLPHFFRGLTARDQQSEICAESPVQIRKITFMKIEVSIRSQLVSENRAFRGPFLILANPLEDSVHNRGKRVGDGDFDGVARLFEGGELAVEEGGGHEVIVALLEAGEDEISRSFQVDELESGQACREPVAVGLAQCGAGEEDGVLSGGLGFEFEIQCVEPAPAVLVGEGDAGCHLRLVGGGMKIVGVEEEAAGSRGQHGGHGALAAAGDAHYDKWPRYGSRVHQRVFLASAVAVEKNQIRPGLRASLNFDRLGEERGLDRRRGRRLLLLEEFHQRLLDEAVDEDCGGEADSEAEDDDNGEAGIALEMEVAHDTAKDGQDEDVGEVERVGGVAGLKKPGRDVPPQASLQRDGPGDDGGGRDAPWDETPLGGGLGHHHEGNEAADEQDGGDGRAGQLSPHGEMGEDDAVEELQHQRGGE